MSPLGAGELWGPVAAAFAAGDDAGCLRAAWAAERAGGRPGLADLWRGRVQVRRGQGELAGVAWAQAREAAAGDAALLGALAADWLALGDGGRALACALDAAAAGDAGAALDRVLAAPLADPVAEVFGCAVRGLLPGAPPGLPSRGRAAAVSLVGQAALPPPAALLAMAWWAEDPEAQQRLLDVAWASALRWPARSEALLGGSLETRPTPADLPRLLGTAAGLQAL